MSKAADTATKVKVLNASLHNEETLNLTWKLSEERRQFPNELSGNDM